MYKDRFAEDGQLTVTGDGLLRQGFVIHMTFPESVTIQVSNCSVTGYNVAAAVTVVLH